MNYFELELSRVLGEALQDSGLVAQKLGIDLEVLQQILDKTDPTAHGKYAQFIAKLMLRKLVNLPKDRERVYQALSAFDKFKKHIKLKDINQYKSLEDLEKTVDPFLAKISNRKGGSGDIFGLSGVTQIDREGDFSLTKVSNRRSLEEISKNTKWCTKAKLGKALTYLKTYNRLYHVFYKNKPVLMLTPDLSQIMDHDNEPYNFEDKRVNRLISFLKPSWLPEGVGEYATYSVFADVSPEFIQQYIVLEIQDEVANSIKRFNQAQERMTPGPASRESHVGLPVGPRWKRTMQWSDSHDRIVESCTPKAKHIIYKKFKFFAYMSTDGQPAHVNGWRSPSRPVDVAVGLNRFYILNYASMPLYKALVEAGVPNDELPRFRNRARSAWKPYKALVEAGVPNDELPRLEESNFSLSGERWSLVNARPRARGY
jgi:hypothetical protein